MEMKIIDSFEIDASKACADSDLVLFAIPVGCFTETAKRINGSFKKGAVQQMSEASKENLSGYGSPDA